MKKIKIETIPASYGDSILITLQGNNVTNILIDAGFKDTYRNHIENKLEDIKNNNQILDLLVFTHIDEDHISGGIALLENNIKHNGNRVKINSIWHNSYKHIYTDEILNKSKLNLNNKKNGNKIVKDISVQDGTYLSDLIYKGNYEWNVIDGQESPICIENIKKYIINDEVTIKVLTPCIEDLKILRKEWENIYCTKEKFKKIRKKELYKNNINDLFELYLIDEEIAKKNSELKKNISIDVRDDLLDYIEEVSEETSVANKSSISFVIEFYEKKMLFMGDALAEDVVKGLKLIYPGKDKIHLDMVKLSHHGSKFNINKEFLQLIDCKKFILSTNGKKHNHPDIHTIASIIKSKQHESDNNVELFVNYINNSNIKTINNDKWKKKYNYEINPNALVEEF